MGGGGGGRGKRRGGGKRAGEVLINVPDIHRLVGGKNVEDLY